MGHHDARHPAQIMPEPRPHCLASLKVALVHDWLTVYGGAERVLEQILAVLPQAELFSLVDFVPEDQRAFLGGRKVRTSFLQHLPLARRHYRHYLPLMPLAIEQFDLSAFDVVISSSYAVAKGVITGPDQTHISYVHSPVRFAWDLQHQYLSHSGLGHGLRALLVRALLHKLRLWDLRTANGVDHFIANSDFIARRVWKVYRRPAQVIHPPVALDTFRADRAREDHYVVLARLVPYKRIDLIVEAFAQLPAHRLVVIGDGPEGERLRRRAPPNVELAGYLPAERARDLLERARAFVFAAEEDFGIAMVEAQACGAPVIAYGKGGAAEIVRDLDEPAPTGVLFHQQTPEALVAAIQHFEAHHLRVTASACRDNAERFASPRFRAELAAAIARGLGEPGPGELAPEARTSPGRARALARIAGLPA
ncbi:MAG: glycosyltransferase family 4 protein [Geminicoccaceae bacterium]